MIDPDFDPREPWCDGLLAGIVILMVSAHLILGVVSWIVHPLERLLN